MTASRYEMRTWAPSLILDVEDAYARERGFAGRHPRPIGTLRFWAVAEVMGVGPRFFADPIELIVTANASGYHAFMGDVRLPDGKRRTGFLDPGRYVIRVDSDCYQRLEIEVDLPHPNPPFFLNVQPDYRYPFPGVEPLRVPADPLADPLAFQCTAATLRRAYGPTLLRGGLHATDGTPIEGATIVVTNQSNTYRTDDTGQWVLWFPDGQVTGLQTVRFVLAPGTAPIDESTVCVARGFETSLGETALRGAVRRRSGSAIGGARVVLSGRPQEVLTQADGSWSYHFPVDQGPELVTVTAVLPNGSALPLPNVAVNPRSTTVVPPFQFV